MPTKDSSVTTVADIARNMLIRHVQPNGDWSATTFAARMQMAGHQWTAPVVYAVVRKGRLLTADEVVGVFGVFKASATLMLREIDAATKLILAEMEKAQR